MNKELKLLIIEDDLIIAENLKENLEEIGLAHIFIATNYQETKAISLKVKPDLFLVDVNLKGSEKDGIDTMLSIYPQTQKPIIYLTSFADNETRERAKLTKPAAYLIKAVSKTQLEVAIDFALSNKNENGDRVIDAVVDHCPFISGPSYFFIKGNDRYEKVIKADIVAINSDGTYTDIITIQKTHKYYLNLKTLLEKLSYKDIVRCHNSHAVNVKYITAFDNENLFVLSGKEVRSLPIGSGYKSEIMARLPRL